MHGTLGQGRRATRAPLGAGPSRGNVGSRRKWGLCPAARPQRGWGPRALSSAQARLTRSQPHPYPAAQGRGPGEQPVSIRGEGRRPYGVTLGSRPSQLWARGFGPRLPGRGGTWNRRGSGRVPRRLLLGRHRPLATWSFYLLVPNMGMRPAAAQGRPAA